MLDEAEVTCPHCWERVSLALDLSVTEQDYIEDCPVCCHAMRIVVTAEDGRLTGIQVARPDD